MKKIISTIVILGLMSSYVPVMSATAFTDLNEERFSWAVPAIQEMSSSGIILGYPDGTFRPNEGITNLQALILIARILGFNDENKEKYLEFIDLNYMQDLNSYYITNKLEIAYLLYLGILKKDELDKYISIQNAQTIIKRHEAAILLVKAMGSEQEVKNKVMTVLNYDDRVEIPVDSRPYVQHVREAGIMQGMTETEFYPMTDVNRAQMAYMLYKVIEQNDLQSYEGELTDFTDEKITLLINSEPFECKILPEDNYVLRMDGRPAISKEFVPGCLISINIIGGKIFLIEGLSLETDTIKEGIVKSINANSISIKADNTSSTATEKYNLAQNVKVSYDGVQKGINDIQINDYASIHLKGNNVIKIEIAVRTTYIDGIVSEIYFEPSLLLNVLTLDDEYVTLSFADNVSVSKNGKTSDLRDIISGDRVKLTLEYGKIKKVAAESSLSKFEGVIEEITISKTPTLKIRKDDRTLSYEMKRDAYIAVDNIESTIYDLRLGDLVTVNLDGNVISEIKLEKVTRVQQLTGRIGSINANYYLINLYVTNSSSNLTTTENVFVKRTAVIMLNSDQTKKMYLEDLVEGDLVTVVGSNANGVFEADTVLIIDKK